MSAMFGPPANLRLVVIDTETTLDADRKRRAVAIGLVVCSGANGALSRKTSTLVNPGCPIDPKSKEKHHIEDVDVADAPSFADAWPLFAPHLRVDKGETLVVVAHNASFDLSLLRDEIARTGAKPALPDLPVLDTMRGLLDASGVETDKRDLETVAAACGVPFTKEQHHDALEDAVATARIARVLLGRAAEVGHADIPAILGAATGGRTATITPAAATTDPESAEPETPVVPDAHLALHALDFPARPTLGDRTRWTALFAACATLRCPEMAAPDGIPDHEKRRLLFAVLTAAAGRRDATAVATVLAALNPLFATLPDNIAGLRIETGVALPRITGQRSDRGVAIALWLHLQQILAGVGRCPADRPCLACRDGLPCPRDTWSHGLAVFVMPKPTERTATAFWNPKGQSRDEKGKGGGRGWTSMRADAPTLADAVLRRCLDFYRASGDLDAVDDVVDQVWREGCRDPGVVAAHAAKTAAGGRSADLAAADAECREVLALRGGNTERAWDHLGMLGAMVTGQLARSRVPALARHAAADPKRPARTPRFLRAVAAGTVQQRGGHRASSRILDPQESDARARGS